MICEFDKEKLLKDTKWLKLIFLVGILLAILAFVMLISGNMLSGLAIAGIALSVILIGIGVRFGVVMGYTGSTVELENDRVIYRLGSASIASKDTTTYAIYGVDKLDATEKAYIVYGDIDMTRVNSKRTVSQVKINRYYENDTEIYNKLISLERK